MAKLNFVLLVVCSLVLASQAQTVNVTTTNMILQDHVHWLSYQTALLMGRPTADTTYGTVYRSTDYGNTWVDQSSKFDSTSRPLIPFYVNPLNPQNVFVAGYGDISYVTSDAGETWSRVSLSTIFVKLEFHPHNPEWVVALSYDYKLYLSLTAGATWIEARSAVSDFTWGDAGVGQVSQNRIYYIAYTAEDIPFNAMYTDDFFKTEGVLIAHAFQFSFLKDKVFVAVYLPQLSDIALKVSPDVNKAVKVFYDTTFPFGGYLQNNAYALLDDSTGAVYLGVNHEDYRLAHWGNLYSSDSYGARYGLSLEHVAMRAVASSYVFYDFDVIRGIEGSYVANQLLNWEESYGTDYNNDQYQSFYTLTNGASWQQLTPPHFDSNGLPIHCTGNCHLHLNGFSGLFNNLGPFYSVQSAIGLIIATGYIGEYLSPTESVNTYLSRDAGLTWIELCKGSSIYEIGDHGGIIVLAPFGTPTTVISYTTDFGTTPLKQLKISDTPILISNIVTEPTSTSEVFIVETETTLITVDFSKYFSRICQDPDYEQWSPSTVRQSLGQPACIMGRISTYRRRNSTAQCFNDEDVDAEISATNCACTEDDYECDFGYTRDSTGECVLSDAALVPPAPPAYCPEGDSYYKTKGYRLEPGNTCYPGVDHAPSGPYSCPTDGSVLTSNKGWIAALVIIPIFVLLITGACLAMRSQKLRDKIPVLKSLATWKVGYFNVQPDTVEDIEHNDEHDHHDHEDHDHHHDHKTSSKGLSIQDDATHHISLLDDDSDHKPVTTTTTTTTGEATKPISANNFFDPQ